MQKHALGRWIALTAVAVVAVAGWSQKVADPSLSPSSLPVIHFQSPEGFVPQDWTLRPRPPIQFTPFEMVDPNTGKPVNADDIIEVNGVKMKAGEFYRQLNAMEQWLNEQGYSLRTDTQFEYYSPTLEEELTKSEEYIKWLEENAPLDGDIYGRSSDFSMASCGNYSNSWSSNWIGNSLFGIQVGADVNAQACLSPLGANVSGSAVLRGRLAGYTAEVARANGSANVVANPNSTDWAYQVAIQLLGHQVWGDSRSGQLPSIFSGFQRQWNIPIAQVNWNSPEVRLFCVNVLGINICANGQVGIAGQVNLAASVNINLFQQQAAVNPYGALNGYARAWVSGSIGIARGEVGIRGNLNFFNGGLTGAVNGQLGYDGSLYYAMNASLNTNLTALSGNLQGYARGCIWFFGWRCAEATATLFSWSGWSYNGTLASWNRTFRF